MTIFCQGGCTRATEGEALVTPYPFPKPHVSTRKYANSPQVTLQVLWPPAKATLNVGELKELIPNET